jgi:hypothetical protein
MSVAPVDFGIGYAVYHENVARAEIAIETRLKEPRLP